MALTHIMNESDFYNYFQHGIDFLISDHTHIVKKIILHTNVVCICFQTENLVYRCWSSSLVRLFSKGTSGVPGLLKDGPKTMKTVGYFRHSCNGLILTVSPDSPPRARFDDRVSLLRLMPVYLSLAVIYLADRQHQPLPFSGRNTSLYAF
jgi:Uncharacterised protein family (UPF0183)